MKTKHLLFAFLLSVFSYTAQAQDNTEAAPSYYGTISSVEYVTSMVSRPDDLVPPDDSFREAKDKRSIANQIVRGQDPQTEDDYFVRNRHEMEQSTNRAPASLVFDTYSSGSQPTDPSLAVGPNHVFVVFNTGFMIYDKSGNVLQGQTAPNPAIFPAGGCCDLTVSYDNAADRWVVTFLSTTAGAQIAVSAGPNPLTTAWYVYTIAAVQDYQKLSVWSDGYYITENTGGSNKVWALERSAMLAGNAGAKILGFNLPGLVTSGFFSPQVLNVTDNNLPAAGGATVVYMQDDAWSGVTNDHIKLWTIDVDWTNTANSAVSAAQQIATTPFISVFDNGSFANLTQPGSGRKINVDALQATIMNQAQFRKFTNHNSAVFNFVVDTDASTGEQAGVRWYEFRQSGDNQPWSLFQEGTYTAPDGRHAWNASLAMDGQGNIGMGYTSMSGATTPTTVHISSYFTGRLSSDPLGTMTSAEGLISNGTGRIPGTRYGDYSKIDVDPSDDSSFWFIDEYYKSGRKGVVGKFQIQAGPPDTQVPTNPGSLAAGNITSSGATLTWTASNDNVGVDHYNISIDGNLVGTSGSTSFNISGLSPLTLYNASVNAEDAAGNVSGSTNTSFTTIDGGGSNPGEIAAYYFETGLDGWIEGGNDCSRVASASSYEGSYSIRLRDNSSTSNAVSPVLDLSGNTEVSIEFHTYASSMETGEDFFVEFFNGTAYQVIGQYISGTDFNNGTFFTDTIILNAGSYNFNTNNRFRIRCDASGNNDLIYFDQVIISGDNATALAPAVIDHGEVLRSFTQISLDNIKLYPNPAKALLNIEILDGEFDEITVFSSLGNVVHKAETGVDKLSIDVSQFASGMYFIRFVSNGLAVTKRFVKE
jgi:hypothetical protein